MRAAVTSGKISEGEAAFLRLSSARWQEGQRARLQAALEGNLPAYDKKTTYGFLVTNEGDVVPLRSGDADPVRRNDRLAESSIRTGDESNTSFNLHDTSSFQARVDAERLIGIRFVSWGLG